MIAEHLLLVIGGALTTNLVLTYLTGLDVLAETTHSVRAASEMSVRVGLVIIGSSLFGCMLQRFVLAPSDLQYLQLPALVLIIAAVSAGMHNIRENAPQPEQPPGERTTDSSEASSGVSRLSRAPRFASYLVGGSAPLAAALLITSTEPTLLQSIALSVGMAAGLGTVLIVFTDLRQRIDHVLVPRAFRGAPVQLLLLGVMALSLSGLSGIPG